MAARTAAVVTAEQLGIYRVLLNHTGRRELQAQFDEALSAVVAEQKNRNLPMLATLKAYLDHGCRAAPAARTLRVHINTLYQRIAVLDRLLGPDWRQPPDRWTCTFYYGSFRIPIRAKLGATLSPELGSAGVRRPRRRRRA